MPAPEAAWWFGSAPVTGREWRPAATFVVKIYSAPGEPIAGLVEHVRSGEKLRFRGLDDLGEIITRMRGPAPGDVPAAGGLRDETTAADTPRAERSPLGETEGAR
jgi:hypothetical protein